MLTNEEKENNYFSYSKRKKNNKNIGKNQLTTQNYFPINDLPDDLLGDIFTCLPSGDLCKNIGLVCKKWQNIVDKDSFWVQKCVRDKKLNKYLISKLNSKHIGWNRLAKHIYHSNIFAKNLLVNSCGIDSFDNWCFIQNFNLKDLKKSVDFYNSHKIKNSTKWRFENQGYGFQEVLDENNNSVDWIIESDQTGSYQKLVDDSNKLFKNFSTSFGEKMQLIDLNSIDLLIMNQIKPDIEISEYYTARRDCGCEYYLSVFLISDQYELIDSFQHHDKIEQMNSEWKCITHVFKSSVFKTPVRYILFYHCGIVSSKLNFNILSGLFLTNLVRFRFNFQNSIFIPYLID